MNRYEMRINLKGSTQRERNVARLKDSINQKALENPSCKDVLINGIEALLVINTGTQPYYKEFETLPHSDVDINLGDYVDFAGEKWLVVTCDSDDEVYKDGKLNQCNWLLKWQNEKGEIIERWAVLSYASKYNDGTNGNNTLTVGSDQLSVMVPVDEETLKLKKSMNKKFFIDFNTSDPTVYKLTGTGNVIDSYDGKGVTAWIVKEVPYTPTEDDLKYGVCEYKTPDSFNDNVVHSAVIVGNQRLIINYPRTLTVMFSDYNGNEINPSDITFAWKVDSSYISSYQINGNTITLNATDYFNADKEFDLSVVDENNEVLTTVTIEIVSDY